jgi:predicted RNase H-like nuclease (RuvC/YqgF family)
MEELPMNVEEQLITLIKGVSDLTAKVDSVQKSMDDMKDMAKTLTTHGNKIVQIETQYARLESKYDKLEGRVDQLEKADGEKAKATVQTVAKYILVAVVGAILSCAPMIISNLK